MAMMLINCSNCRTPLQLPPGVPAIRCAVCQAVTTVYQPRASGNYGPIQPAPTPPFRPQNHVQYTPTPPHPGGSKKAVIVGIQYKNSNYELKGCLNDAKCMKYFLQNRFHFPEASIIMLTEEERDPLKRPTKHNIRMALYWLVQGCKSGDSLVFHFSGHGSQQRNLIGDEVDGMDETICPVDFETQGMIVDDEINTAIVRPLPPGVRLHAIVDACHSGTVLDLPWLYHIDYGRWEDQRSYRSYKGTNGGEAYSFSGCDDDQTSADTSALSKVTSTGAMTFCFIQAVERSRGTVTYGSLLNDMRQAIQAANQGTQLPGGPLTSLVTMLLSGGSTAGGLTQRPQLTANEAFDVNRPFSL
ncbi:unnamed protein product [Calypogeia fissa]